ncbi:MULTISPECIES: nucleoside 2-deoxyribosyltransferase [Paenibacillus]|uniref:nucleoside 2-deoxyribosyltransferase n=1 Tax=Paenibacillus TaxID=44249 RepID=UPI0019141198|nr:MULTISPECIES: nucleoside 2-deoxyribosyltransferase [Paenibacillus]
MEEQVSGESEQYIVIAGVVARCKARVFGGQTFYLQYPYDGSVRAVNRESGGIADVESYVFGSKEAAQQAVLGKTLYPCALTWQAFGLPSIYLAGFHVFRPDAVEEGRRMRESCRRYGFEGLFPLDKENYDNLGQKETAAMIFHANDGLIREADIVMANLNPFRGAEPDSGTVFECGLGYALGKKLYGYIADGRSMSERLRASIDPTTELYSDGMHVENFDLPLNLMLAVPMDIVIGGLEECLLKARIDYYGTS